ncbi:MAG: transcription termination factor NusA [bacterium]|nr:transcription termination factor NusA [bacterium]
MAISPFVAAINQICDEKGLSKEVVIETVEAAIAAAYRKDYGHPNQIIRTKMDPETGQFKVSQIFEVVDEIEEENAQMTLDNARKFKKAAEVGDEIEIPLAPHSEFGRIAAQTAKQVIIQRIREAERNMLYDEFKQKEHQLLNGNVQQIEGETVTINLGKINGILLPSGQIPNERYYIGQRVKVFVTGVEESTKGPRVLVSRSDPQFISALFSMEIPEINSGSVEIMSIAREAGSRTKIAVYSDQPGLDPVGSCVGQRGTRVQSVLAELSEEKIDIILWNEDRKIFIINALSPAKVESVELSEEDKKATVKVPDDQLSLAIGKMGQNVRLASKLTGWSIDIVSPETEARKAELQAEKKAAETPKETEKKTKKTTKSTKTTKASPAKKPAAKVTSEKPATKKTSSKKPAAKTAAKKAAIGKTAAKKAAPKTKATKATKAKKETIRQPADKKAK